MTKTDTYPKKCATPKCRGMVLTKERHTNKCDRCRFRMWRDKNPLKYHFGNLRRRATERGIKFSITFEEYKKFSENTDYGKMRGRSSLSLSIDRIEGGLGYHLYNIRTLRVAENSRKQFVSYFNGGALPSNMREEYLSFEKNFRDRLESVAATVSRSHKPGSLQFWKEFRAEKDKLFKDP